MATTLFPASARRPNASLTLLTRALREDQRLKQGYLARMFVVAFVWLVMANSRNSYFYSGAPGLSFFDNVIRVNLFFISIAGLGYFAGAITEEKEEGTLGLLRMTGMSALSILLGKSTSRLFNLGLLLVAQVPFTLLAVTLGGVSTRQIFAVYASLAAALFLLANLALLASVIARRTREAAFLTGGVLTILLAGPYLLTSSFTAVFAYRNQPTPPFIVAFLDHWEAVLPFNRIDKILTVGFNGPVAGWQVAVSLGAGVGCFALAWWVFDFFTRGSAADGMAAGGRRRRWVVHPGRAWRAAVLWKDYHFLAGGWTGLAARLVGYTVFAGLIIFFTGGWQGKPRVWTVPWQRVGDQMLDYGLLAAGGELALWATQALRGEIDGKTLSALAMLPRSLPRQMIRKVFAAILMLVPAGGFCVTGLLLDQTGFSPGQFQDYHWERLTALSLEGLFVLSLAVFYSLRMRLVAVPVALATAFFVTFSLEYGSRFMRQYLGWNFFQRYGPFSGEDIWILGFILLFALMVLWRIWVLLPKLAAEN